LYLKVVLFRVSGEIWALKVLGFTSIAVKQTPFTAILSPILVSSNIKEVCTSIINPPFSGRREIILPSPSISPVNKT
jgi:hypothetical protein